MTIIAILICAYLAGSIPTGVWYSKLVHKIDVRTLGSGNSGGTNVGRNFGPIAALIVIAVDVLKGWIPMAIAKHHFAGQMDWVVMLVGILAVLGHAYPLFGDFRGGKVVATSIGVMLGYHFSLALIQVFLLVVFLYLSSMVSFAAMTSYLCGVIWIIMKHHLVYGIGFALISMFMMYRHRQNIQRILNGNERRVSWGLGKKK